MAFLVRDLAIKLASAEQGDKAWMAVIGCGAGSVDADGCGGGTQTVTGGRAQAIDYIHGLKTVDDVRSLKACLSQMLGEVAQLEDRLVAETAGGGAGDGGGTA